MTPTSPCTELNLTAAQRDVPLARTPKTVVHWNLSLPEAFQKGPVAAAELQVDILTADGKGAGWSSPAWFAAGVAPVPVTALQVTGTRQGVLLGWQPVQDGGEVLLAREQLQDSANVKAHGSAGDVVTLQADPENLSASHTLDTAVQAGIPMRYVAFRRTLAQVGGHRLEIQSAPSTAVTFTWKDIYPPPAPTGLRAVAFRESEPGSSPGTKFSVDLVWEPVEDANVAGYMVERTPVDQQGVAAGPPRVLTSTAVVSPAFHDATAQAGQAYRYSVLCVDGAGNRSAAESTVLEGRGSE